MASRESSSKSRRSEQLHSVDRPVFVISVAAELAGMHPQTLRQYDRIGLVQPSRAPGKARRYSQRDVNRLQQIQQLSQEGVSLEGIRRIIELESLVEQQQEQIAALQRQVEDAKVKMGMAERVFAAGTSGDVVYIARGTRPAARQRSSAVVLYRQRHQPVAADDTKPPR